MIGLAGIREYPPGQTDKGDIDSGTLIMGLSPAATGFTIAPSRIFQDRELYLNLYRSINFFSETIPLGQQTASLADSPVQRAILLAVLTAMPIPAK
jgi:hypothetical protein